MPLVNKTFDQLLDFTRTSAATFVGSNGLIQSTAASRNLFTQTQQFDNAFWTKTAATVTANSAVAPDGTSTADTLTEDTTAASAHRVFVSFGTAVVAHTASIYVKAGTRSWFYIRLTDSGSVQRYAYFNVGAGTLGTVETNLTADIEPAGNGWYRCTATVSASFSTGTTVFAITTGDNTQIHNGDGTGNLFIWGAQLEAASAATDYTRNNGGVFPPRFDYDPVTLAPKGLQIEEQRTNLLVRSAEFDNASWVLGSATITANSTTSPDGTTNADTLTSAAATAATYAQQSFTATAVAHTFSLYVKANGARYIQLLWAGTLSTNYANFDLTTATVTAGTYTSASITSAANGWFRVNITSTLAAAAGAVNVYLIDSGTAARAATYTGDGTSGIFLYGAQLEAGAFATSYIPTVASQVTRTADQCSIVAPNFAPWYNQSEGTMVVEADTVKPTTLAASAEAISANDGTSANRSVIRFLTANAEGLNVTGGAVVAQITQAYNVNSVEKLAFAIKANDFAFARNGSLVGSDTSGAMPVSVDRLFIGGPSPINGHIRSIRYYPTRLTNAQLQALTA